MGITLSGQTGFLLSAVLLGFVLGAVYDIFRVFRVSIGCGRIATFFLDIIYWLFCACATFVFLLLQNNGSIRTPAIIGEIAGAALYYYTIGTIVIKRAAAADRAVKSKMKKAGATVIKPVRRFSGAALSFAAKKGRHTGSFLKKETNLFKIRLKVHCKMMYNLIRSYKKQKASPK